MCSQKHAKSGRLLPRSLDDVMSIKLAVLLSVGERLDERFELKPVDFLSERLGIDSNLFAVTQKSQLFILLFFSI